MTEQTLEIIKKSFETGGFDLFYGKTYGDFHILPTGENIADSRSQVSLKTKFSKGIPLNQPVISANMLDITESEMAITMALLGNIGIIHRFCLPDYEADEVRKVKRAQNFVIEDPHSVRDSDSIGNARNVMDTNKVGSLVVVNEHGKLSGLLTRRDIRFIDDSEVVEVHMTPLKPASKSSSSRKLQVVQESTIAPLQNDPTQLREFAVKEFVSLKVKKLPIIDEDGHVKGLISAKDVERLRQYPLANLDKYGRLVVGATVGAAGDFVERAQELKKAKVDVIVLDVTSAHSTRVRKAIEELRRRIPGHLELVVGNIGTSEQANFLINLGVDGIKIGIGPGGVCMTRLKTGIGVPQLFAVLETYWNLIFKYNHRPEDIPPLCADGGINNGMAASNALFGGASSIMVGSLLAATQETPGNSYSREDGEYKLLRGMASFHALLARNESRDIEDPEIEAAKKATEGMQKEIRVKGSVRPIIKDLTDGMKSAITHRGKLSLEEAKDDFNPFDPDTGFHGPLSLATQKESKYL